MQYTNSNVLTRRFVLKKGNIVFVSYNKNTELCEIGIEIPEEITSEELNTIPRWKGMEEKDILISDKAEIKRVLSFEQLKGYDQAIFVNVMQDVCDNLEKSNSNKESCVSTIKRTLQNWSVFFQLEREYVLSVNVQQC